MREPEFVRRRVRFHDWHRAQCAVRVSHDGERSHRPRARNRDRDARAVRGGDPETDAHAVRSLAELLPEALYVLLEPLVRAADAIGCVGGRDVLDRRRDASDAPSAIRASVPRLASDDREELRVLESAREERERDGVDIAIRCSV